MTSDRVRTQCRSLRHVFYLLVRARSPAITSSRVHSRQGSWRSESCFGQRQPYAEISVRRVRNKIARHEEPYIRHAVDDGLDKALEGLDKALER